VSLGGGLYLIRASNELNEERVSKSRRRKGESRDRQGSPGRWRSLSIKTGVRAFVANASRGCGVKEKTNGLKEKGMPTQRNGKERGPMSSSLQGKEEGKRSADGTEATKDMSEKKEIKETEKTSSETSRDELDQGGLQ